MIKRILLVSCPDTRPSDFKVRVGIVPPLGLAYLAAVLEQKHYEVRILDALVNGPQEWSQYDENRIRWGMSDAAITNYISAWKPGMVGVTCPFAAREWDALNICKLAKEINPEIVTVVGGAHATCALTKIESLIKTNEMVDYIIHGEGEISLLKLIAMLNGTGNTFFDNLRPLRVRRSNMIECLDDIPFPARHLLPMHLYMNSDSPHSGFKQKPHTNMITSRGCPNSCRFCCIREVWGPKARYRSAENVLAEIDHLVETYGIKEIHIEDDSLTSNKQRAKEVFQGIIDRNYGLSLNSPSGLNVCTLDKEMLELMKAAGYYSISIAIESGDESILRKMRKPIKLSTVPNVIETARSLEIECVGFFILGYPEETLETMNKTIKYAASLSLDWACFFVATPIPGSELERQCQENGWLIEDKSHGQQGFYKGIIKTPFLDPKEIEEAKVFANKYVNFENNTNMKEGDYAKALRRFELVAKYYPQETLAWEYIEKAKLAMSHAETIRT